MSDRERYSEYSKPIVVKDILHRFPDFDGCLSTGLEEMEKTLKTVKSNLKKFAKEGKIYRTVKFELEEQYNDSGHHPAYSLVIIGKRQETEKETQKRIETNYFFRLGNLVGSLADIEYWLSDEGQDELKKIRLGKNNPMRSCSPAWLDFLDKIRKVK